MGRRRQGREQALQALYLADAAHLNAADAYAIVAVGPDLDPKPEEFARSLVHGTLDDNVHLQNTIKLVDALVKADKDFELQLYPGFRHGVWGPHYQR
ncbi:MAG: prolyl oligopeptidase family serine peptidase, partial [Elusimicrobiota bacterium]